MRLLVVTQSLDEKDPVLGFFVSWVRELAKVEEKITVICLRKGVYTLPSHVSVFSLGKESIPDKEKARGRYSRRFLRLVWELRNEYDTVFVHMNQEYILLAGLVWKSLGKKIFLWRNHYSGSLVTNIAASFCDKIFYTSSYSYTARFKKALQMPVGVDIAKEENHEEIKRLPRSILFLGRLDESKRVHLFIEALGILSKRKVEYIATIAGAPSEPSSTYPHKLEEQIRTLGLMGQIHFVGAVPHSEIYRYFRSHELYVNASKSGMLDKTIFEAMHFGSLVLTSSGDMAKVADSTFIFKDGDATDLADKIQGIFAMTNEKKEKSAQELQSIVEKNTLPVLVSHLRVALDK